MTVNIPLRSKREHLFEVSKIMQFVGGGGGFTLILQIMIGLMTKMIDIQLYEVRRC